MRVREAHTVRARVYVCGHCKEKRNNQTHTHTLTHRFLKDELKDILYRRTKKYKKDGLGNEAI